MTPKEISACRDYLAYFNEQGDAAYMPVLLRDSHLQRHSDNDTRPMARVDWELQYYLKPKWTHLDRGVWR